MNGTEQTEGGSAMYFNVSIDWKFVVALGAVAVGIIFAVKMDGAAAERVSTLVVEAGKEVAIAGKCDRRTHYIAG